MGEKHDAVRWAVGSVSRTAALLLLFASVLMAGGLELRYGANSPEKDYAMESSPVSCAAPSECPGILVCENSQCRCPYADVTRCKDVMSSMSDGVIIKCKDIVDCINVSHSECIEGLCRCKKNYRFNVGKMMCEINSYIRSMNNYRPSSQSNMGAGVVDYSGAVKLALGAAIVMLTGVIVALIWNLCRNRSRPSGNQNENNQGPNSIISIPRLREPPPRYTDIFSITTPHQGVRFHDKPPSYEEAIREQQQRIAAAPAYINLGYTTDSADRTLSETSPSATNTGVACNSSLLCRTGNNNESEPSPVGSVRGAAAAAVASVTSIFGNFRRTRSGRPPRYDPESFPSPPTFLPVPSTDTFEAGLMGVEDENPSPTSAQEITFGPLTLNLEMDEGDKEEVNADNLNSSSVDIAVEQEANAEQNNKEDNQSVDSGIGSVPSSSIAIALQSNQTPAEIEATAVVQDSLLTNISASTETEVPQPNIPIIVCDASDIDNAKAVTDIPSCLGNREDSITNQNTKEETNISDNIVINTNSEISESTEIQPSSSDISVPRNTPTGSPSKINSQQIPDVPVVAVHRLIELEETDVSFV